MQTIMKNNQLYIIKYHLKKRSIVILFIIFVMFSAGTYAWFTSSDTKESNSLVAGSVQVTLANTLQTSQYLLPGEDITGNVSITNTSNVDVYLRVKIFVNTVNFYEGTDTFDTIFDLALGSNWVKKGDWYYYKGLLTSGTNLNNIITGLTIRGTVGNEYQGKTFTINSISDAIQGTTSALDGTWILSGDLIEADKVDLNY